MKLCNRACSVVLGVLLAVTIVLFVAQTAQANMITNGDFESGNTGFNSDYIYKAPNTGSLSGGLYSICDDPSDAHTYWFPIGDHTGSGLMMVANGATTSGKHVWKQQVTLTAGYTYCFSAWATGVFDQYPATLDFQVDGTSIGTLGLSTTVPDWQEFSEEFTADTSGPVVLSIYDPLTMHDGNDFALDDLSLTVTGVPEPSTLVVLLAGIVSLILPLRRR